VTRSQRPVPPPLEANDRRVTIVGTVAWAVALVVLLALRGQIPASNQWWIWTGVAGVCMGLFALWYVPRFKRARARKAQRRAETQAAAATQPCSNDSKTVSSTETPGTSTRS
jgi:type VI protein secretion system component VasK